MSITTWGQYKSYITTATTKKVDYYFRGLSSSSWPLRTTFHRAAEGTGITLPQYLETIIPELHYHVCAFTNEITDPQDPREFGALLGLLRHHGFPTPLLDWTLSPFIAAFFAFRDVDQENPQSDNVKIYIFDHRAWASTYEQPTDLRNTNPYLSVFRPFPRFNPRIVPQRGTSTITNIDDIESYLKQRTEEKKVQFLWNLELSVKERPLVMRELNLMGINDMSMFPGLDGLCRTFKEQFFTKDAVGPTPQERLQALSELISKSVKTGPLESLLIGDGPQKSI
jgi:hypothetical protein